MTKKIEDLTEDDLAYASPLVRMLKKMYDELAASVTYAETAVPMA